MIRTRLVLAAASCFLLLACGGRSLERADGDDGTAAKGGTSNGSGGSGGGGSGNGSGGVPGQGGSGANGARGGSSGSAGTGTCEPPTAPARTDDCPETLEALERLDGSGCSPNGALCYELVALDPPGAPCELGYKATLAFCCGSFWNVSSTDYPPGKEWVGIACGGR